MTPIVFVKSIIDCRPFRDGRNGDEPFSIFFAPFVASQTISIVLENLAPVFIEMPFLIIIAVGVRRVILKRRIARNLDAIFEKDDFTKAEVVDAIKAFIPNFQHEETGKNFDQKM